MSEAVQVAFFTGGVALIIAIFSEPFKKWRDRPKLKFKFKLDSPFCHETVDRVDEKDIPVYCFLFHITNSGKTTANNCEATIEEMFHATNANNYEKEKNFASVNLVWSLREKGRKEYRNINPGQRVACDLGSIIGTLNGDDSLRIKQYKKRRVTSKDTEKVNYLLPLILYPYSQKNYLPPGTHKLKVSIYSENAKAVHKSFTISWSGQWRDNEKEMFKECKIKML